MKEARRVNTEHQALKQKCSEEIMNNYKKESNPIEQANKIIQKQKTPQRKTEPNSKIHLHERRRNKQTHNCSQVHNQLSKEKLLSKLMRSFNSYIDRSPYHKPSPTIDPKYQPIHQNLQSHKIFNPKHQPHQQIDSKNSQQNKQPMRK